MQSRVHRLMSIDRRLVVLSAFLVLLTIVSLLVGSGAAQADTPQRDVLFGSDRVEDGPDIEDFGFDIEIFAMRADGTDIIQLTDAVGSWSNGPDWSPNGKRISFFRCAFDTPLCDVWVMYADGSGELQLTDTPGAAELDPRWSPDGKQLLFNRQTEFDSDLLVMDADGSNERNITNTPTIWESFADWSPNGKEIVYEANGDVVRHSLRDGTTTNLTQSAASFDFSPVWSPNGKKIAFTSDRDSPFNFDIYVMDADGSNIVRLTDHELADYIPHWSRNGKQIYFDSDRDGVTNCPTPVFFPVCSQLYVMDADGSNQTSVLVEGAAIHRFIVR